MLPPALRQEFATLQKSFLDFAGLVGIGHVANPDPTLQSRARGQGLKLYAKVEEDCHASAVIQQRKYELIARRWKLDAPPDPTPADEMARDLVQAQLNALGIKDHPDARDYGAQGFDGVALNFLDATYKGYATGEVMWHQDGREVFAAEVRHKDQRRFGFTATDGGHELRLLTRTNWLTGEPIPRRKLIYHSPTATDVNPYGLGLDSKIFWPVFFKRQGIQFWLIFADKFGSPTPIGKYSPGESDANKKILMEALSSITQGMAAVIPEGMTLEFIEAIRSGSVQTYEGLCRYMDEQISECILGQTGTTNQSGGGGSRARDEVAKTGTMALVQADADLLARTFDRTLVNWIVELNRPMLGDLARPPHLSWIFEESQGKDLAERDTIVASWGYEVTPDYVQATYGDGFVRPEAATDALDMQAGGPTEDVQQTALNDAQIKSLLELIQQVAGGLLPLESAYELLLIAFPAIDEAKARAMLTPTVGFQPPATFPNLGNLEPTPTPTQGGERVNLSDPLPLEAFAEDDALPPGQLPEAYRRQASATLGPVVDGWVAQVRGVLDAAADFDQFSDGLVALYPDLAKDQFADLMRDSLLAAHLGGMAEVDVEAADDSDLP